MATDVIITGTGSPNPAWPGTQPATAGGAQGRSGAGALVRHGDCLMQFDAGRNTVGRLAEAGIAVTQLSAFFGTHHHSDHLTGLDDLVLTRWILDGQGALQDLPVVVPAGPLVRFVERMLDPWEGEIQTRKEHSGRSHDPSVAVTAFDAPNEPTEVWRSGGVRVLATRVRHHPVDPSVGYRIETPDGVVVISGDTSVCDELSQLAAGADVVVHEALRVEAVERLPYLKWIVGCHADTLALGAQAKALEIPTLVLTHLIPPPSTTDEMQAFEADIRSGGFRGRVVVANDLDTVTLDAGRVSVRSIRGLVSEATHA